MVIKHYASAIVVSLLALSNPLLAEQDPPDSAVIEKLVDGFLGVVKGTTSGPAVAIEIIFTPTELGNSDFTPPIPEPARPPLPPGLSIPRVYIPPPPTHSTIGPKSFNSTAPKFGAPPTAPSGSPLPGGGAGKIEENRLFQVR